MKRISSLMPWKLSHLLLALSMILHRYTTTCYSCWSNFFSAADTRKQQATEYLNRMAGRGWITYPEGRISYNAAVAPPGSIQLDSHANMRVFGKYCFIISKYGKEAIVNAFTDQVGTITFPIVDAAVAYDCPWSQTTYILITRNILSVPSIDHNLIPPFILREDGLTVNGNATIHLNEPSIDDHAIICPNSDQRIRLHLHGTVSWFSTRMLTPDEILDPASWVVVITPEVVSWNPQCTSYQLNE